MKARELKKKYLKFFESKGHKVFPSASLIPENDPTVLFTTAGMHPLVPFLLGQKHPLGKRLANVQKCIRTDDIYEIGDNRHLTFFEMLGNWSLGDYFKKEAIQWSWEFLIDKKGLGFDPNRLFITAFKGDRHAPRDEESIKAWSELFKKAGIEPKIDVPLAKGGRIFTYDRKENWWGPVGKTGPCGPNSEMFYDTGKQHDSSFSKACHPNCDCGRFIEIWNDVFMEYNKNADGKYELLKQKNVDTGLGFERVVAILQNKETLFDTELFEPIISAIKRMSKHKDTKSERIVADHLRSATFILGDDMHVTPSNLDRGYVLRRLIRRAVRYGRKLGIENNFTREITKIVIDVYRKEYEELKRNKGFILRELEKEESRFRKILERGINLSIKTLDSKTPIPKEKYKEIMKLSDKGEILRQFYRKKNEKLISRFKLTKAELEKATLSGKSAFLLYQSHGFPLEMILELVQERRLFVDVEGFRKEVEKHREISRKATEKKFRSGLADQKEETIKLHTATHLLQAALRKVLGDKVAQRGSNITPERLRFDFSFGRKPTEEELKKVEDAVNENIKKGIPVKREEMSLGDARKKGAIALFEGRYDTILSVYSIRNVSKEVCTGPHVGNTKELGKFKIIKEESVAAGVRRIKAKLV